MTRFRRYFVALQTIIVSALSLSASDISTVCVDRLGYEIDTDNLTASVIYVASNEYTSIEIPTKITVQKQVGQGQYASKDYRVVSIANNAFKGNSNLRSVTIPNTIISIGSSAFANCTTLYSINLPASITEISNSLFNGCSSLVSVSIPNSVTQIGQDAFSGCTNLKAIIIPNSVTNIGAHSFYECSSLTSILLPESVVEISTTAFNNCDNLNKCAYPSTINNPFKELLDRECIAYDPTSDIIEDGFVWSADKQKIIYVPVNLRGEYTIPESVTTIGESAFSYCSSLTSVTIPTSITSIPARAFFGCSRLADLAIPQSVKYIGEKAFERCNSLTSVAIPRSVTYIGSAAFADCSSLQSFSVDIENANYKDIDGVLYTKELCFLSQYPAGRTTVIFSDSATGISYSAFEGCRLITSVRIPESVTEVGYRAFYECKGLKTVEISKNTKIIGSNAFENCPALTEVYSYSKEPPYCGVGAFYTVTWLGTLYVPAGTTSEYQATNVWRSFNNIVELPIEGVPVSEISVSKESIVLLIGNTATLEYNLKPDDASNKDIRWTSSDPEIATVSELGEITAVSAGETSITVMTKDGTYLSASCAVKVVPESIFIVANGSSTLKAGQTLQLKADVYSHSFDSQSISWTSSNESVATVDNNGLVTANNVGTTIIKASHGNISSEIEIIVEETLAESICIEPESAQLTVGDNLRLVATFLPSTTTNQAVQWTSNGYSVASVDHEGVVSAISKGEAIITAKTTDGTQLLANCRIQVSDAIRVDSVRIVYSGARKLYVGDSVQLSYNVFPENAADKRVSWSVTDESILRISDDGYVQAVGPGRGWIFLRAESNRVSSSIYFDVSIKPDPLESITLFADKRTLKSGESTQVYAILEPYNAIETIEWGSSDEEIATVTDDGIVTAHNKTGQVTITAIAENGISGEIMLTITESSSEPTSLHLNVAETTFHQGSSSEVIEVISTPSNATPFINWSYVGDAILTIHSHSDGTVSLTASNYGNAILTAQYGDWKEECKVTVLRPAFNPESINYFIDGEKLEYEQVIDATLGETIYVDAYFNVNITNKYINNLYYAYSSDVISINELSREEYEPFSSGFIVHYAVDVISEGESALYIGCGNAAQRVWINAAKKSGIARLESEVSGQESVYYDLHGNQVANRMLVSGLYIKKTGNRIEKVFIGK